MLGASRTRRFSNAAPRKPPRGSCARCSRRKAAISPLWMPTVSTRRASSTCGSAMRSARSSRPRNTQRLRHVSASRVRRTSRTGTGICASCSRRRREAKRSSIARGRDSSLRARSACGPGATKKSWSPGTRSPSVAWRTPGESSGSRSGLRRHAGPSRNAVAAWALGRLAALTGEPRYARAAERTLALFYPPMREYPAGYAAMAIALAEQLVAPKLLVLRGREPDLGRWHAELAREPLPDALILALPDGLAGLPTPLDNPKRPEPVNGWLCRGVTCLAPISDLIQLKTACKEKS